MFTYNQIDDAIKYIKEEQEKPLVAYYFGSRHGKNAMRVEQEISSGALVVNDCSVHTINSDLPFGGVGFSGQGRYHGQAGFDSFSNLKSILVKPTLDFFPFNLIFPPYTNFSKGQILSTMRFAYLTQDMIWRRIKWVGIITAATSLFMYYKSTIAAWHQAFEWGLMYKSYQDGTWYSKLIS